MQVQSRWGWKNDEQWAEAAVDTWIRGGTVALTAGGYDEAAAQPAP
jgi:hypothetical protein